MALLRVGTVSKQTRCYYYIIKYNVCFLLLCFSQILNFNLLVIFNQASKQFSFLSFSVFNVHIQSKLL